MEKCWVCARGGSFPCPSCKSVHYCSHAHQLHDWNAGHDVICGASDFVAISFPEIAIPPNKAAPKNPTLRAGVIRPSNDKPVESPRLASPVSPEMEEKLRREAFDARIETRRQSEFKRRELNCLEQARLRRDEDERRRQFEELFELNQLRENERIAQVEFELKEEQARENERRRLFKTDKNLENGPLPQPNPSLIPAPRPSSPQPGSPFTSRTMPLARSPPRGLSPPLPRSPPQTVRGRTRYVLADLACLCFTLCCSHHNPDPRSPLPQVVSKLTVERLVPVALSKKQHFYIYVIGIVAEAKPDPVHTVLRQYADLVELNRQMEGFLHKKHIPVLPSEKKIRKNQSLLVAFLNQYMSLSDILNNSIIQEFLETRNWTTALDARRPSIMFNNKARGLQPEDWVAPPDGEIIEVPLGEQNNLGLSSP